jgi:hypothetical protein
LRAAGERFAAGRGARVTFRAVLGFGFGFGFEWAWAVGFGFGFGFEWAWAVGFFFVAGRRGLVRRCLGMSWSNRRRRPGNESGLAALT